jgi:quinoprotein glucose dehydrogenase
VSSFPGPRKLASIEGASRPVAAQTARTVWDGVYTEAQAERGRAAYSQSCAACHREDLRGDGTAPSLVGESFAFLWGDMTVGELFTRTRAIMPPERPGSLSPQGYVDIIAFVLQKNAFPAGGTELGIDRDALQQIRIITKRPER